MKKLLPITVFVILFLSLIYAETQTKDKMNIGSKETVNGKTVTILAATMSGSVKVDVDGKKGMVENDDLVAEINGMKLRIRNFTYIDYDFVYVSLEMTVDTKCGDGICNTNMSENSDSCCSDCNCTAGECINNICQILEECQNYTDCDDNQTCTLDKCENSKCSNQAITECKKGDNCCPTGCSKDKDEDCEIKAECSKDEDCNDNNACTTEKCQNSKCQKETQQGCNYQGKCYNITETFEKKYCTEEGVKEQKAKDEKCSYDYECEISKCYEGTCNEEPRWGLIKILTVISIILIILGIIGYFLLKKMRANKEQSLYS